LNLEPHADSWWWILHFHLLQWLVFQASLLSIFQFSPVFSSAKQPVLQAKSPTLTERPHACPPRRTFFRKTKYPKN
jgi:hypothetical protein